MRTDDREIKKTWLEWISESGMDEIELQLGFAPGGCENCSYGIVSEPELDLIAGPLYLTRAIAAAHGAVLFCDCRSGELAREYTSRILRRIPAHFLDQDNRLILGAERNDGSIIWHNGTCPKGYVPRTLVEAVVELINQPPTVHGAEREEEDMF